MLQHFLLLVNKKTTFDCSQVVFDFYSLESEMAMIKAITPMIIFIHACHAGSVAIDQLGINAATPIRTTRTARIPSTILDIVSPYLIISQQTPSKLTSSHP